MTQDPSLALDRRTGWPTELRFLLDRYPRQIWPDHPNLGALCRFWLERHAMFQELATALSKGAVELREGRLEANSFSLWFAPRMRFFLQQLHHHHMVEDHSYFPLFAAAEPRLVRGFGVLEADHGLLDRHITELGQASATFLRALQTPAVDRSAATAGLATALPGFLGQLDRHLRDEEDLIIPLILERSETALGVG